MGEPGILRRVEVTLTLVVSGPLVSHTRLWWPDLGSLVVQEPEGFRLDAVETKRATTEPSRRYQREWIGTLPQHAMKGEYASHGDRKPPSSMRDQSVVVRVLKPRSHPMRYPPQLLGILAPAKSQAPGQG
jgi:hypothetical protein